MTPEDQGRRLAREAWEDETIRRLERTAALIMARRAIAGALFWWLP